MAVIAPADVIVPDPVVEIFPADVIVPVPVVEIFPVVESPPVPRVTSSANNFIFVCEVCAKPPMSSPALFRQIRYDAPLVALPDAWKISRARFLLPTALPIFAVPLNWAATTAGPPPPAGDIVPAVKSPVDVTVPAVSRPVAVIPPVEVRVAPETVPVFVEIFPAAFILPFDDSNAPTMLPP